MAGISNRFFVDHGIGRSVFSFPALADRLTASLF